MKDYLFQLVFLVILTSSGICNAPKDNAVIASKGNPGNDIASLGNTENDMASLGNTENDMAMDKLSHGNTANDMAMDKFSLSNTANDMASLGNTGNDIAPQGNTVNDLAPQGNTGNDIASLGNTVNDIAPQGNTANDMASLGNTANDMSKDINKKHPRIIHGKIVCEKDWIYDDEKTMCIKCPAKHHTEKEGAFNRCFMKEDILSTPTTSQSTTTVPILITKQTASLSTAASIQSTIEKNVDREKVDSTTMVLTQTAGQVSNKDTSTSATAQEELLTHTIPPEATKKKENQDGPQPVTVLLGAIVGVQLIVLLGIFVYFTKWRDCKCTSKNFSQDQGEGGNIEYTAPTIPESRPLTTTEN